MLVSGDCPSMYSRSDGELQMSLFCALDAMPGLVGPDVSDGRRAAVGVGGLAVVVPQEGRGGAAVVALCVGRDAGTPPPEQPVPAAGDFVDRDRDLPRPASLLAPESTALIERV